MWLFWAERSSVWALLGTCATVVLVVVLATADKAAVKLAQAAGGVRARTTLEPPCFRPPVISNWAPPDPARAASIIGAHHSPPPG